MGRIQSRFIAVGTVALTAVLALGSAHADTVLDYTETGVSAFAVPGGSFTFFDLSLDSVNGDSSANSFSVKPGDTIDVTVTTASPSASFLIPANSQFTSLNLLITGSGFDGSEVDTTSNVAASATLAGMPNTDAQANSFCSTSSQICDPGLNFPAGSSSPVSFDTYTTDFTVSKLSGPVTINSASIEVFSQIASVPEPQSYALMTVGLGLLGLALRRRTGFESKSLVRAG